MNFTIGAVIIRSSIHETIVPFIEQEKNMTNTKDIIIKLKEVRDERKLSYNDILALLERNGDFLSKTTISRVFADGSEETSFRYEETLRPIANALLDIENLEEDDSMDVQAMKSLLKYKIRVIEDLERQVADLETALDKEKIKYHEKLDKEREQSRRSIDFLKEQISLKDKRMDILLESLMKMHAALLNEVEKDEKDT